MKTSIGWIRLATVLLLLLPQYAHAQTFPTTGQRLKVVIQTPQPDQPASIIGEVTSVSESTFVIFTRRGTEVTIRSGDVESAFVSRGYAPLLIRGGIGAAVGLALGYFTGLLVVADDDPMAGLGEILMSAAGTVVGGIAGMYYTGPERWEPISLGLP